MSTTNHEVEADWPSGLPDATPMGCGKSFAPKALREEFRRWLECQTLTEEIKGGTDQ